MISTCDEVGPSVNKTDIWKLESNLRSWCQDREASQKLGATGQGVCENAKEKGEQEVQRKQC